MTEPAAGRIILDTDTGADDALAIILALLSPELKVEAVTTVSGNVHVDLCTRNALLVIESLGLPDPPPVCKGAALPLEESLLTALEVHGYDGIGGITGMATEEGSKKYPEPLTKPSPISAPEIIVKLARDLGHELSIVTLGPLTNAALAIRRDRDALMSIREIIIMGGAFRVYGNTSTVAEFNIFVDPHAAEEVLQLGVPVTIIPLDVTERTILFRSRLLQELERHQTKALELAYDISSFYMDYHAEHNSIDGCYMHDPLAVGVAINPGLVQTVEAEVHVERVGEWTRGMTVADLRPSHRPSNPNARVAVDVDADGFVEFFLNRLI